MRIIKENEMQRFFNYIEETLDENVYIIRISNASTRQEIVAELERQHYGLRVNLFNKGAGWYINQLDSYPLDEVVNYARQCNPGGIYISYEENSSERHNYATACNYLCDLVPECSIVLQTTREEFSQLYRVLKSGTYLVHVKEVS